MSNVTRSRFDIFRLLVLIGVTLLAQSAWAQGPQLEGGFKPATPLLDPPHTRALLKTTPLWDSWEGEDARTGKMTYGPFPLPKVLELYVAGFPTDTQKQIFLADSQTAARLVLRPRSPPGDWVRYRWSIPPEWVGRKVNLVAIDEAQGPGGWVGLSAPVPPSSEVGAAFTMVGLQATIAVLLLLPGLATLLFLPPQAPLRAVALMVLCAAALSYAAFFIYFASPTCGRIFSWIVCAASLLVVIAKWPTSRRYFQDCDFLAPVVVSVVAAMFYFVGGFLYGGTESASGVPLERFLPSLPPDPLLPYWVAEKLARGESLRPFFSDWLTSDRPPLQSGMNLLFWPFASKPLGYLAVGVAAQSWVWLGLWIFLRRLGTIPRYAAIVLAAGIFSGFFFLNSFFCWPKLLPTAFLLIAAAALLSRTEKLSFSDLLIAASASVFSLLGHGGSVFGLIALALLGATRWIRLPLTHLGAAFGLAVLLMLPWQSYQKFWDPPGDRLVKYHLAGHEPIDSRSSLAVIREAYETTSLKEIVANKVANFRALLWGNAHVWENLLGAQKEVARGEFSKAFWHATHTFREAGFFHYLQTLGPWLLALPGIFILWRKRREDARWQVVKLSGSLAALNAVFWCLLMFKGSTTVIHQSSYFLGACLFVCVGLGASAYPRPLLLAILAINFIWFTCVWTLSPLALQNGTILQPAAIPGFWVGWVILAVGLCFWLVRIAGTKCENGE